jgi:hypothetical protein
MFFVIVHALSFMTAFEQAMDADGRPSSVTWLRRALTALAGKQYT